MNRYLLNSAVITAPGDYRYTLIEGDVAATATAWLDGGPFQSGIRYPDTAQALREITGVSVRVAELTFAMQPGDEALVFRLHFPPGTPRVPDKQKGKFSVAFLLQHCEFGILKRVK